MLAFNFPSRSARVRELRKQMRDLKRMPAEKTAEVNYFKGALQKVEVRRQSSTGFHGLSRAPP